MNKGEFNQAIQMLSNSLPQIVEVDSLDNFALRREEKQKVYPLLPLRNAFLFPGVQIVVHAGRERSIKLLKEVQERGGVFAVLMQHNEAQDPTEQDLFAVGTMAELVDLQEESEGRIVKATIRGRQRIRLKSIGQTDPYLACSVQLLKEKLPAKGNKELPILLDSIQSATSRLLQKELLSVPEQLLTHVEGIDNPIYMVSIAAYLLSTSLDIKYEILEQTELMERAYKVLSHQENELEYLEAKGRVETRTRSELDRQQKEYFLQQQIKSIQAELGREDENPELAELRTKAQTMSWGEATATAFEKELQKVSRMHPQSPEYSIQMQYLNMVLTLPWGIYTEDNFDLDRAKKTLDRDHCGLEEVKERILEHLAVLKLKGDLKSPIICLYGPPGVGKTSLGKSIADSLGRKYVRLSLGGVHDESEIRGHRRTYIGAMCGRIIKGIQGAGSSNPVFVLDEIDKVSDGSHHGDPASALLEVLDPEQNMAFHDNYLDMDYDLSKVLFIATANNVSAIPQALRDRMELIEVSGYLAEEKVQIARKHLIPKTAVEHGLGDHKIKFTPKAIDTIIEDYTRESGVRGLGKRIAKIFRKIAWRVASGGEVPAEIVPSLVAEYLGKRLYSRDKYQDNGHTGVVVGLAWTSVGGEILFIESSLHPGTEAKLILTGSLGDVMKESAILALDYIRAHASELGIASDALKGKEIHIHVPEGAVPKDGPSAGITITTSLVSALTHRKVRSHLAMTGEITLRGKVLPVGGIKEKILAAKRAGIKDVILCSENRRDVEDIASAYIKGLTFHYVDDIKEVIDIALLEERVPLVESVTEV